MTPACTPSQWHTPHSANHLVTRHRAAPPPLHTSYAHCPAHMCRRALTTGPAALIWYPVSPRESGSENGCRTAECRPCPHLGHSAAFQPEEWHLAQVRTIFRSQEVSLSDLTQALIYTSTSATPGLQHTDLLQSACSILIMQHNLSELKIQSHSHAVLTSLQGST